MSPVDRALCLVATLALLWCAPVGAAEQVDGDPAAAASDALELPSAEAVVAFPDPLLMRRAKRLRNAGIALSVAGGVAFVTSFNLALAVFRSGDDSQREHWPAWGVPCIIMTVAGLQFGGPLWSVGSEMVRQLTRNTRGDEKLRREVANDPRYWKGRTMSAFGTTLALTGGLEVMFGSLILVGLIWVFDQSALIEEEAGQSISRAWILLPAGLIAGGTASLIGGLKLRQDGEDRSQRVRDAYATAEILVIPYADPVAQGGGLAVVGRF
jgi:hypothetical protein